MNPTSGSHRPRRILVVRPDRIGDVVLITPMLRALRQRFPDCVLAALVRPYAAAVLEHNPHLDLLLQDDPEHDDRGVVGFLRRWATLRRHRFDTALMPLPHARYAWLCLLAGIRTRLATSRKAYNLLTFTRCIRRLPAQPPRHEADYCLDLARAIGVPDAGLDTEMILTADELRQARAFLGSGRFVGIHPGSGRSAPNWPVAQYVELAERLLRELPEMRLVVTGGAGDRALQAAFDALPRDRVVMAMDAASLRQTAAILACLDVLVSASTGPMHVAAALRVPTVSLFCPLSACAPALWGPQGNRARIVLPEDGYCQIRCPGDPHVCTFVGGIAVPDVLDQVLQCIAHRGLAPSPD